MACLDFLVRNLAGGMWLEQDGSGLVAAVAGLVLELVYELFAIGERGHSLTAIVNCEYSLSRR